MPADKGGVFVFAEYGTQAIEAISLQLVGKARQLADELDSYVGVILLGKGIAGSFQKLVEAGADLVFQGDSDSLVPYQAEIYSQILVELVKEYNPEILLVGSTSIGRELAPLVAARLETGLTAHCIDLSINASGILEQRIPAYGGLITIICPRKRPQMATIAEGVFPNPTLNASRSGRIVSLDVPKDFLLRAQTLEIITETAVGVSLDTASIIVAGGAGVGDLDGWNEIVELASVLNAGLGSTRPVVDAGWADFESMIGQSGKMVNPVVYIAAGISGDLQHMVGVIGPRIMIAINNDPKSKIFKQVDYGVVEDCRVLVPALVQALKNR